METTLSPTGKIYENSDKAAESGSETPYHTPEVDGRYVPKGK